jgi:hypothetical protein
VTSRATAATEKVGRVMLGYDGTRLKGHMSEGGGAKEAEERSQRTRWQRRRRPPG